ncbi:MAG: acyltransferase [Candidatus Acidiferrales bacterium]
METTVSSLSPAAIPAAASARVAPPSRFLELDGFRGFALIMVIFSHFWGIYYRVPNHPVVAGLLWFFDEGGLGLDAFFVLSGFLIGGILLNTRPSPNYFKTFYVRRFYRVLPISYLWVLLYALAAVIGVAWFHARSESFRSICPLPLYLLSLQSWFVVGGWTWWPHPLRYAWYFLGPMWSLSVEEQYYFIAPALVKFLSRRRLVYALISIVVAAPILRFALIRWMPLGPDAAFSWLPCRMDSLSLGMLAALLADSAAGREWIRQHVRLLYGLISMCVLLEICLKLLQQHSYTLIGSTVGKSANALLASFVILVLVYDPGSRMAAVCRWGWVRYLAKISYCVYLIQLGVALVFYKLLLHGPPPIYMTLRVAGVSLIALIATLILASVSWRYFEQPLVRLGHRYKY